jgi:hypothetical protein
MNDLQFERADFGAAPASLTCTGCHQPIAGDYFDVNGRPFCAACTSAIRQAHGDGTGAAAFPRALGAGLVAGAVGSALYYIVEKISGYQLALIAIAVGFLVGRAVRWGTGGRGGLVYQLLAVALTYTAIAFSWLPFVLQHNQEAFAIGDLIPLTSFMLGLPIRIGLESPFTLVVIGIGLWEAWKFTAPVPLAVTGPFAAAPATAIPPVPDVPAVPVVPPAVPPAVP